MAAPASRPIPSRLTVTEAARRFSEVVSQAAYLGRRFTLMKGGRPVAELGPVAGASLGTAAALARAWRRRHKRLPRSEATAFARDVAGARRAMGRLPRRSAWD